MIIEFTQCNETVPKFYKYPKSIKIINSENPRTIDASTTFTTKYPVTKYRVIFSSTQ